MRKRERSGSSSPTTSSSKRSWWQSSTKARWQTELFFKWIKQNLRIKSLYCYGLLGGINRGFLDKRSYLPAPLDTWEDLLSCVDEDGKMGYAQLVVGGPAHERPSESIDYANGAFLLAASELYKMDLGHEDFLALKSPFELKELSRDGAWTWFNDERVLYDGDGI
ncbi:glycoside hydrolase family 88 protein [Pelagicoccus sp. SDUM812002]|uniref:glycoside hydrolase family 88 protein n=1 Tax=Pelagicoccus sp. SDUM812002 TaxID=3041266 RepID=UPI00280C9A4C|nr:glycoside hydrolase family 88 protein [Pelagicoccus sp. SDUM812002]MDQ8184217.1 glycoside hydrolase family 88 protein [Pelagicoccus sp. SDUM812002]